MSAPDRVHGGEDGQGAVAHDFSTNVNACGPCPPALAAVRAADPTRYPDPRAAALREALARFHGVAPWRILPAASASEFILRITAWAARRGATRVHVPAHAYGDYAHAAAVHGLAPAGAGDAQLAWACDPSSPLGQPAPLPDTPGTVVLDLAYAPLRLEGGAAAVGADRAWQLWTPNKALGLAGLRAAYAIAPADAADEARAVDALAPSWPLGAHGVALLQAWTTPAVQQWLAASRDTLRGWKAAQEALCRGLGWELLPSVTNFFVARADVAAPLRARGIRVRDCTSFGLPGHVRLSVQPPAAQAALREALR